MFNLMISYNPNSWNLEPYEFERTRFMEYTEHHIREQFKELTVEKLEELKTFPTLFAIEGDQHFSRIGYITNIKVRSKNLLIEYKFDPVLPLIPQGTLEKLEKIFDIPQFERNRTHWAIKDDDLLETLVQKGYLHRDQVNASLYLRNNELKNNQFKATTIDSLNNNHVFIVHGRDEATKYQVSTFISSLGLIPIILHEQANMGKTIIEKIETYTNVGFAVVLYTPCDVGAVVEQNGNYMPNNIKYRARQNVVLEHGYLMAKLGRKRVTALVKGSIETPNDISGVVYLNFDNSGNWQQELKREIIASGISIIGQA